MARLRVTTGKSAGKTIEVGKAAIIGRGETAQLQINDAAASREHCKVFEQAGQWVVADLNSRNGIKVNGVQTTRKNVQHGDTIQIGETVLTFETSGAATAPSAASPAAAKSPAAKPAPKADDVDELDLGGDAAPATPAAKAPAASKPATPAPKSPAPAKSSAGPSKKEEAMAAARADAAKAAAKTAAAKAGGGATKSGATSTKEKEGMKVSDHVLQFHKVDTKHAGVTDIDLGQMPGTTKFLILLGCIAVLAAIVWAISMMMG